MAVKEGLRQAAGRVRRELGETGRVVLHAPVLMKGAECAIHFLLGAILSFGRVLGDASPFGVALVASSGSGVGGLSALLGFTLGILSTRGFTVGLRYAAAAILVFSVSFAFYDLKLYKKVWFMPTVAALLSGCTGFVYLSAGRWSAPELALFLGELVLTAGSTYFYTVAFSAWQGEKTDCEGTTRQKISGLLLGITVLISLAGLELPGGFSVGRLCATLCVVVAAYLGGVPAGVTAGICCGIAMDLASGGIPLFSMISTFAGLLGGVFWKQGKGFCALAYALGTGVAMLWTWETGGELTPLYECLLALTIFLVLPQRFLRRCGLLLVHEKPAVAAKRAEEFVRTRIEQTAEAFRDLAGSLKASLQPDRRNDGNPAAVFTRAAEQVCRGCSLRDACWQRGYTATYAALNDALPTMLDRGRGVAADFPDYFRTRCMKFPTFLERCNEEVSALLLRRQYESRLAENRTAFCGQYGLMADVLARAAMDLSEDLTPDPTAPPRAKLLDCETGLALRQKTGETVSGDGATFFETASGMCYVLLCDGMGSGKPAHEESALALRLLEQFLRAGVAAEAALKTLNSALALRYEEECGFSTVDLLALNLHSGEGRIYKYGAAPTYFVREGAVRSLGGVSLPAGLSTGEESAPDCSTILLQPGDLLALVSDGVVEEEDLWLRDLLRDGAQTPLQALAQALVTCGETAKDDKTAVLVRVTGQRA
ncbi:MAG: SpoIIE family protein phosphatase [Oscillospiraceae bacterium]